MDGGDSALVWSPGQQEAIDKIDAWLRDYYISSSQPIFKLAGFAGTGKTTLAKYAVRHAAQPAYMAFTAKAAAVMRENGCKGARNIHQYLYKSRGGSPEASEEIRITKEKVAAPAAAAPVKGLSFDCRPTDDLLESDIIVVDEASMVDDAIAEDLLEIGKPILALFDPAQLPPVGEGRGGLLTAGDPDVFLTDIHRQAEGDPIIAISMRARQGQSIGTKDYGDRCFVRSLTLEAIAATGADQLLCGRNATRRALNDMIRQRRGYRDWLPEPGERLVCLRNRHDLGLFNGGIVKVKGVATGRGVSSGKPMVALTVRPEGEERDVPVGVRRDDFYSDFDFGYCLTVHKAQGSQWDSVLLVDESYVFRKDRYRWLYTGITRARSRLCVARVYR
jgi:exodeoxyribonuclease-5